MTNYSKLLQSPKWQKKRLEIMNLRGFKCEECGAEESQLHVHHRFYLKNRKPWEYDNDVFQVLCDKCHEITHEEKVKIKEVEVIPKQYEQLFVFLSQFNEKQIDWFITAICSCISREDIDDFNSVMCYVASIGFQEGFRDLMKENYAQQIEIELGSKINELSSQVDYLIKMTGYKLPERKYPF